MRGRKKSLQRVFSKTNKRNIKSANPFLNYYVPRSNGTFVYRGGMRNDTRREKPVEGLKTGCERSGWLTCNPNPTIPSVLILIHHPFNSVTSHIIPTLHYIGSTRARHKCIYLSLRMPRCPIQPKFRSRLVTLHMHPRLN